MVPCTTTTAGRHEADRQRERERAVIEDAQEHARRELDRALRSFGLTTHPHFEPGLEDERSLWVNCRLGTAQQDRELVYAILDDKGWGPDSTRLSRIRLSHDVLRLAHTKSGAQLVVIIKVPYAQITPLEAA